MEISEEFFVFYFYLFNYLFFYFVRNELIVRPNKQNKEQDLEI